jgi:hypothetical protein
MGGRGVNAMEELTEALRRFDEALEKGDLIALLEAKGRVTQAAERIIEETCDLCASRWEDAA